MFRCFVFAYFVFLSCSSAFAGEKVKDLLFNEDTAYHLHFSPTISTYIQLADDEVILGSSIGDSKNWVVNDDVSNGLFVKAGQNPSITNMNLFTNYGVYLFTLDSTDSEADVFYKVRFNHGVTKDRSVRFYESRLNSAPISSDGVGVFLDTLDTGFLYSGSKEIVPAAVFSDKQRTYFKFDGPVPSIFSFQGGEEVIVNYRKKGSYIVVDGVLERIVLRLGDMVTCLVHGDGDSL